MNLFKKRSYIKISPNIPENKNNLDTPSIPNGMWVKCSHCGKTVYQKELTKYKICPQCQNGFRLSAWERISITCDVGSFQEWDITLTSKNPMNYPNYEETIKKMQDKTGIKDAVITGKCTIDGFETVIGVMDSNFMMASMGSVVGEKITRAIEKSTEMHLPIILFTASGGARMQEGIISLMQMAKTSAALKKHCDAGLLYISVMTDPTTGGVAASFASLGDIILSEPGATIGFAGRRVIEGTIGEKLPETFQTAEFQIDHGFIDKIVGRMDVKETLAKILHLHCPKGGCER